MTYSICTSLLFTKIVLMFFSFVFRSCETENINFDRHTLLLKIFQTVKPESSSDEFLMIVIHCNLFLCMNTNSSNVYRMSPTIYFTKKCISRSCKFELGCSCKVRNLFAGLCTSTKIICVCISAIS